MAAGDSDIRIRVRSVFVSDVHLGSRDCRAGELGEFLAGVDADYLFLVGDIIDFWSLRRSFYWPPKHGEVLRTILAMARQGTRVIYIPGNHDEDMREFCGSNFGNLQIRRRYVHTTAAGERLLLLHGDEFDAAVRFNRWLAWLGVGAYAVILCLNRLVNLFRRLFKLPYWSLAGYLKLRSRSATRYVDAFERAAAAEAARCGAHGIVCGHIHRAAMRELEGVTYYNDGDWVESCTAMIEDMNGKMSMWSWGEQRRRLERASLIEAAA